MTVLCKNKVLADKVSPAFTFYARLKGLMGKKSIEKGEGILLFNCPAVHCFFMKIPIDVVYLTNDFIVLAVETVLPWKIGGKHKSTAHILELPAGSACVFAGDKLDFIGLSD